ncbi:ABC transporter substrate-binding protein [Nocardiopsis sp. JB363]|uniref:ABC transporter substrate-binding protein n=1 Tax=Nocardiopsis sp. JB363 TaxID=1434837 RepID=UPI00097A909A|nr:ABC transporter substrate-binding protein [Nocardiopsis sp. JB363]SIO85133.1 N-Acetyl-D-glucosamine ABC transport system, sugar-binding protein [Nocardiopsis sp. JB363]
MVVAATGALVLALTSCSGSGDSGDVVELRFSWWGSDERHANLQEVIEVFEAENPGIRVSPDYTDWDAYWDRLATGVAADDAPDVIMQDESYLTEYADRGALADLSTLEGLDLSSLDPLVAESGMVDGALYGAPTGVNASAMLADPEAFAEAGVQMPDDTTWTWDDYVEISIEISEATDGEIVGTQGLTNENAFHIFVRQHGENLFDEDGEIAFTEQTLQAWYELTDRLLEGGGQPDASQSVEIAAGGPDQSVLATNTGATAHFWSNQLGAVAQASGRDIELLRFPGETENERTGTYFKPAMYYSVSAGTDHPQEAAGFVDFLLNSGEVGEIVLADLGLPANTQVREQIMSDLPEAETRGADFLADIEGEIVDGNPPPPVGSGEIVDINRRAYQEFSFGNLTAREAAEQFVSELRTAVDSGT